MELPLCLGKLENQMTDLTSVTFNIPVKIDSPERLENLKLTVDYILHHFNTNIIVYEVAKDKPIYNERNPRVKYIFECIRDNPFHRTRYLNEMALISHTPIIANYDCDVLFNPENYITAAEVIQKNGHHAVFPYDGLFLNVPRTHIPQIQETKKLSFIDIDKTENFGRGSVGGAIFWDKKYFIAGGMENEEFVSWGCEDWERIKRFAKLGCRFTRINGPLYHITHPRGSDSSDSNPHYQKNQELYNRIEAMNEEQIRNYINNASWVRAIR